jgi:hypothetical protein
MMIISAILEFVKDATKSYLTNKQKNLIETNKISANKIIF